MHRQESKLPSSLLHSPRKVVYALKTARVGFDHRLRVEAKQLAETGDIYQNANYMIKDSTIVFQLPNHGKIIDNTFRWYALDHFRFLNIFENLLPDWSFKNENGNDVGQYADFPVSCILLN